LSSQNGGKLEVAQAMAANESARTTGLYDRSHFNASNRHQMVADHS
jgi:hypothetical protein